jgi:glycosyltransferase involved in cell wall biosynthesis
MRPSETDETEVGAGGSGAQPRKEPLHDDDILVLTEQYWDAPKRIAHKMPLAWAEAGNRVLWIEQPPFPMKDWRRPGQLRRSLRGDLRERHERLWVGAAPPAVPTMHRGGMVGNAMRALHRPALAKRIRRYMTQLGFRPKLLVLMQQAVRYDLLPDFPDAATVYYCHDLFGYGFASQTALAEEAECCRRVDQVWTTSDALRQRLWKHNPGTHHVPHALDEQWWDRCRHDRPEEFHRIAAPRALFTGPYQTEKLDTELLIEVAERRPGMNFVFVGPLYARPSERHLIDRAQKIPNMHWLGERRLEQLAGYIDGADVLMLPYRLDDVNASFIGLGVKFYEYMISGKPVCATPYTRFETVASDLITVANGPDAWAEALDRSLAERGRDLADRRESLARQNTYDRRIEQQRLLLTAQGAHRDRTTDLSEPPTGGLV